MARCTIDPSDKEVIQVRLDGLYAKEDAGTLTKRELDESVQLWYEQDMSRWSHDCTPEQVYHARAFWFQRLFFRVRRAMNPE